MKELIDQDLAHVWHPCSQMQDYEEFSPIVIEKAQGSYFELDSGQKVIDAISSWWCKSLGHGHPRIKAALQKQMDRFEHVILANTTNDVISQLSAKLAKLSPSLTKVFYASDGASATEIAMKMSLHAHQLNGQSERTHFIALKNGYHGETIAALSASDLGLYREPYQSMLFDVSFIENIPYVSGKADPLWQDCSEYWQKIEMQLTPLAKRASAIILEPIVQGAGGLLIYSADFLKRLRQWCDQHGVHLIADEIMTGLGRTGLPLACQHADIEADFVCLGKALTAGWLPLSATLTSQSIYDLFYDDYQTRKAFLHSHTYAGNPLAAACALETLNVFAEENIYQRAAQLEQALLTRMQVVANVTGALKNTRAIGGIVAADLNTDVSRAGYQVFKTAVKLGAFLRPIGNTLYWLPPLNVSLQTLDELQATTIEAIQKSFYS